MKNQILKKLAQLIASKEQVERQQLQTDLYHLVMSARVNDNEKEFEARIKNSIVHDIVEFVKNPNPVHKDNLRTQLELIGDILLDE